MALRTGSLIEAARACNNLGVQLYGAGELSRAFELLDEATRLADRAGHADMTRFMQGMQMLRPLDDGRWDDCLRMTDAFIAECEAGAPHTQQAGAHCHRGMIRLGRGDLEGAVADAERALELAREVAQPDRMFQSLAFAVRAFAEAGEAERARQQASEFDFLALDRRRAPPVWTTINFAWAANDVGHREELDRLLAHQKRQTKWNLATRAVVRGEYAEAAALFAEMGTRMHEAYARLRAAEQLATEGRRAEADAQLTRAVAFFHAAGATRWLREAEALGSGAAVR